MARRQSLTAVMTGKRQLEMRYFDAAGAEGGRRHPEGRAMRDLRQRLSLLHRGAPLALSEAAADHGSRSGRPHQ